MFTSFADIVSSVKSGNNLVVTLTGSATITVLNHFVADNTVENAKAGGVTVVLATGNIGGNAGGIISGTEASDVIDGRGGDDLLYGNGGNDRIFGGDGDDLLVGGRGCDVLWGGDGADTFKFFAGDGRDRIRDFQSGEDVIALDRLSFGLDAGASAADVIEFGHHAPHEGRHFLLRGHQLIFDADWSNSAGRETIATFRHGTPDLGDFLLA